MGWILDSRVRSAMVSDALDTLGVRNQVMTSDVRPLRPDMRTVGIATTVQFGPSEKFDPKDPYGAAIDFLDTLRNDEVAVVATGKEVRSAFWGELFSAAALGRGAAGVICDGPLRDTQQVVELGFPAFGNSIRAYDYKGRMRVIASKVPVICGGVTVHCGDGVIADADGVVVVPADLIKEVTEISEKRANTERTVLKDLLSGKSVRDVWNSYGVL